MIPLSTLPTSNHHFPFPLTLPLHSSFFHLYYFTTIIHFCHLNTFDAQIAPCYIYMKVRNGRHSFTTFDPYTLRQFSPHRSNRTRSPSPPIIKPFFILLSCEHSTWNDEPGNSRCIDSSLFPHGLTAARE